MIDTAKACRKFIDAAPEKTGFPAVVNGFTGSSIWHWIYAFPPTDQKYWQKGFDDFAKRWTPILDAFDKEDVNQVLEVMDERVLEGRVEQRREVGGPHDDRETEPGHDREGQDPHHPRMEDREDPASPRGRRRDPRIMVTGPASAISGAATRISSTCWTMCTEKRAVS